MRQAIHILKKDARYLRYELLIFALLLPGYVWANTGWADLLIAITAVYLIARLIQAETIPGHNQFWLTRPYSRVSLVTAKLLGLVVFINLPLFTIRLVSLVQAGFPWQTILGPLAWSQFLILIAAMAPIAALAAITHGIVPFTFSGLLLLAIGFAVDHTISPPSRVATRLALSSSQWVWNTIALVAILGLTIPVLYLQYRHRRTVTSRFVIVTVGIIGSLAFVYFPWPAAAAIQTRVSPRAFDPHGLEVQFDPSAKHFFSRGMMWQQGVQVDVPITVHGIPIDVEALPDAVSLTFETPGGRRWSSGLYVYPALAKMLQGSGPAVLNANVDVPRDFFEHAKRKRVRVSGTLYLTVFGNARAKTIPLATTPVDVADGLQCFVGAFEQLTCRSPFRWPARLVYAQFTNPGLIPLTRSLSYSPFPAGLGFDSVESRYTSVARGAHEVTIVIRDRLASLSHDFEIDNFPLAELSTPVIGTNRRE
jgi:hypothetical protein